MPASKTGRRPAADLAKEADPQGISQTRLDPLRLGAATTLRIPGPGPRSLSAQIRPRHLSEAANGIRGDSATDSVRARSRILSSGLARALAHTMYLLYDLTRCSQIRSSPYVEWTAASNATAFCRALLAALVCFCVAYLHNANVNRYSIRLMLLPSPLGEPLLRWGLRPHMQDARPSAGTQQI